MKKQYSLLFFFCAGVVSSFAQNTACNPDTILHSPTVPVAWAPDSSKYMVNKQDTAGVYQIYVGNKGDTTLTCISSKDAAGNCCGILRHWYQRNKMMAQWHPSGNWIICGVEREWYQELVYTPYSLLLTFLETGWKLDMWATTPDGNNWYQLADSVSANGNGMVGPAFTKDGTKGAWAQLQDSSQSTDAFGLWYMMLSEFTDTGTAGPALVNTKNINPPGSRWIEPGNFAPDGKSLLISSDIGMTDAEGQDQFILDINTGATINLTNSPKIWDEHGIFSPDGKKILFMSSYPYRTDTNSYKTLSLKTEFMLMDASVTGGDSIYYPGLQQLTHFNVPGYVESTTGGGVAATGEFSNDGSEIYCQELIAPDYDNWIIRFKGDCGNDTATYIREKRMSTVIFIYPNPATDQLSVLTSSFHDGEAMTVSIMNVPGVVMQEEKAKWSQVININVKNLTAGIYFLQLKSESESVVTRFVKE